MRRISRIQQVCHRAAVPGPHTARARRAGQSTERRNPRGRPHHAAPWRGDARPGRCDPDGSPVDTGPIKVAATAAIAARFGLHAAGRTSTAKLVNAAPFRSASAGRPGVDPANNESECTPEQMVTAGRIRFRTAGMGGKARMFPDIMT